MNYRHAFHAGNFADVVKHALLARIVAHLKGKERPFRVVDTHAGTGLYDLGASPSERTSEWRDGFGRLGEPLPADAEALLEPYRAAVASVRSRQGPGAYPGSPALLREWLRPNDRAVLIEPHPEDAALLRGRFGAVGTLKVMEGDGWALLPGLIPPRERRGLVFVDPPYEEPGELSRAASHLARARRRWPTGILALWYPIKDERAVASFAAEAAEAIGAPLLRAELTVRRPDGRRLAGTGLLVANPPWRLADEASCLLPALAERLAQGEGAAYSCTLLDRGAA